MENEYEFCPRCEANLTMQKGYSNTLPYWICKGCGEMLINPDFDAEGDIIWLCDGCEDLLNAQPKFTTEKGKWKCCKCGYINKVDSSEIYLSEDEFKEDMKNPYRNLGIDDLFELFSYDELRNLGGKSNVFLVEHQTENKLYVKKILDRYDLSLFEYLRDNPIANMPKIKSLFENNGKLIVIEEYIPGTSLEQLLDEGPIEEENAIDVCKQLCLILRELHNLLKPIIHRDIKPSNIIVSDEGYVYLLDINVSKWYRSDEKEDTQLFGTLYYAAPEQLGYGFSASSEKTDIYAMGVLFNVMLTGEYPKNKKAPSPFWEIIEACICLEQEKRMSVEMFYDALCKLQ